MGSGDEAGKDGSEGRNGKHGDDFALSGVKSKPQRIDYLRISSPKLHHRQKNL
jgi:hypothetical protein